MWTGIPLFPAQASTMASRVDGLYFFLLAVSTFFSLLIAGLIVFYAIRYPGRSPATIGAGLTREGRGHSRALHEHLVPADDARPLSLVLRGILRHAPFGNDGRSDCDGSRRLSDVAERRNAGRVAGVGGREALSGPCLQ